MTSEIINYAILRVSILYTVIIKYYLSRMDHIAFTHLCTILLHHTNRSKMLNNDLWLMPGRQSDYVGSQTMYDSIKGKQFAKIRFYASPSLICSIDRWQPIE